MQLIRQQYSFFVANIHLEVCGALTADRLRD
jgi:hypothetical protein